MVWLGFGAILIPAQRPLQADVGWEVNQNQLGIRLESRYHIVDFLASPEAESSWP